MINYLGEGRDNPQIQKSIPATGTIRNPHGFNISALKKLTADKFIKEAPLVAAQPDEAAEQALAHPALVAKPLDHPPDDGNQQSERDAQDHQESMDEAELMHEVDMILAAP